MSELTALRVPVAIASRPGRGLLPPALRLVLRGGPTVLRAAAEALGLAGDAATCRALEGEAVALLWLGPDERLVLLPEGALAVRDRLAGALGGLAHSLVEVSHRQVAIGLDSALATQWLATGCALDLDPAHFPVGMCTRTMLGKAEIVLWRRGAARFHLEIWRSFAPYVAALLEQAASDLGPFGPATPRAGDKT